MEGCLHRIFIIHMSVDGHLGCFHTLATVNSTSVNIAVQISLKDIDFNSFGLYPRVGYLDHMVIQFLIVVRRMPCLLIHVLSMAAFVL